MAAWDSIRMGRVGLCKGWQGGVVLKAGGMGMCVRATDHTGAQFLPDDHYNNFKPRARRFPSLKRLLPPIIFSCGDISALPRRVRVQSYQSEGQSVAATGAAQLRTIFLQLQEYSMPRPLSFLSCFVCVIFFFVVSKKQLTALTPILGFLGIRVHWEHMCSQIESLALLACRWCDLGIAPCEMLVYINFHMSIVRTVLTNMRTSCIIS